MPERSNGPVSKTGVRFFGPWVRIPLPPQKAMEKIIVPVEISARHIHLTQKHFQKLFGKKDPTPLRKLSQSQFAAKETVDLVFKDKVIKNVRIVYPFRKKTQVELSLTDAIHLKIKPVFRLSGDLKNTPGIKIVGPKGEINLKEGVIIPLRHLHISPEEAKKLNLKNKEKVKIRILGKRALIFENVIVRVKKGFNLALHLDTDEGNAAGIPKKGKGILID